MGTFYNLGLPAYYGVITSSLVAYIVSFIVCLIVLHGKYKVNYENTVKNFMDILCGCMLMVVVLFLVKFIIPLVGASRISNLFIILVYAVIGAFVYIVFMIKMGTINNIFGDKLNKLLKNKRWVMKKKKLKLFDKFYIVWLIISILLLGGLILYYFLVERPNNQIINESFIKSYSLIK